MDKLKQISEAIVQLKWDEIAGLTNEILETGVSALEILNQGLVPGMSVVGTKFRKGEIFLPEVLDDEDSTGDTAAYPEPTGHSLHRPGSHRHRKR